MVMILITMCQKQDFSYNSDCQTTRMIYGKNIMHGKRKKLVAKKRIVVIQIKDSIGNIHHTPPEDS